MKKMFLGFAFILLFCAAAYGQSSNPFIGARWQGRIAYKTADGAAHSELYELILVPNGTCIVTVSGRQGGKEVFQDADGLWSFDDTFFRLECDFAEPVFAHLGAINWVSVYQFDALETRFTLLIKPYPGAANNVRAAFMRVDD